MEGRLKLREPCPNDLVEIMAIEYAVFRETTTAKEWEERLSTPGTNAWVVESLGQVVAFVVYTHTSERLEIEELAVAKNWRRIGLGTALVGVVQDRLRGRNLRVDVDEENLPGQLFFRKLGLRCVEILHRPWPGYDVDGYRFVMDGRGLERNRIAGLLKVAG